MGGLALKAVELETSNFSDCEVFSEKILSFGANHRYGDKPINGIVVTLAAKIQ
jgi:hypothetical protein